MKPWILFILPLVGLLLGGVAQAHGESRLWIDVRSAQEYAEGHMAQAVNIPHDRIGAEIADLTKDKTAEIVLYCRSGRRAELARQALAELGYVNLINAKDQSGAEDLFREHSHSVESSGD